MSGRRIEIVEVVEPCEHGSSRRHFVPLQVSEPFNDGEWCPGGSRRVLTEGQYVLIEKTDGRWPEWALNALDRLIPTWDEATNSLIEVEPILDALSDHTEGTP